MKQAWTKSFSNEANDLLMHQYFESLKKEEAEEADQKLKKNVDFGAQRKKVSSAGSSLTSSPTSTSSLESAKKRHDEDDFFKATNMVAKPPDTPKNAKSAGSTYRRNLLRLSQSKSLSVPNEATVQDTAKEVDSSRKAAEAIAPMRNLSRTSLDLGQLSSSRSNVSSLLNASLNWSHRKKLQPIESRNETNAKKSINNTSNQTADSLLTPLASAKSNQLEKILFNANAAKSNFLNYFNTLPYDKFSI